MLILIHCWRKVDLVKVWKAVCHYRVKLKMNVSLCPGHSLKHRDTLMHVQGEPRMKMLHSCAICNIQTFKHMSVERKNRKNSVIIIQRNIMLL